MATPFRTSKVPSQEKIAQRAYEIWLAEGRPEGRALVHWQTAEEELRRQSASPVNASVDGHPFFKKASREHMLIRR